MTLVSNHTTLLATVSFSLFSEYIRIDTYPGNMMTWICQSKFGTGILNARLLTYIFIILMRLLINFQAYHNIACNYDTIYKGMRP